VHERAKGGFFDQEEITFTPKSSCSLFQKVQKDESRGYVHEVGRKDFQPGINHPSSTPSSTRRKKV